MGLEAAQGRCSWHSPGPVEDAKPGCFLAQGRRSCALSQNQPCLMSVSGHETPVVPAGIHFMLDTRLFQVVSFWHPVFYIMQSSSALDQLLEIGAPLAGIFILACLYPSKSCVCSAALPYGDVRCDWPPGVRVAWEV